MLSALRDGWGETRGRILQAVKESARVWQSFFSSTTREEVMVVQLRIGHALLIEGCSLDEDLASLHILWGNSFCSVSPFRAYDDLR
jgi:hypothetical protein